jgi:uncharacterized membrane protein HdeD (DUF308 family)
MSIKRKYVDSHWLIFAFEGVVALLFGWFALFTNLSDTNSLISIIGSLLLGLGIIELFNLLRRTHLNETWGFSLIAALIEVSVAFALIFTSAQQLVLHLALVAGYTVIRGIFEVLIGLRSVDDITDKFIWVATGICGAIMGFVILNTGSIEIENNAPAFIKFFGSYMALFGFSNLIYGVHNCNQVQDLKEERKEASKKAAHTKKATAKTTTVKKATAKKAPAKKTTAKKTTAKKTTRKK